MKKFLSNSKFAGLILGILAAVGGLNAQVNGIFKHLSHDSVINVQSNKYGIALVADGTTDNCSRWISLEAAVPAGSWMYFPKGNYHFSGVTCPNGAVLTHSINLIGESRGSWNGTTFVNGTLIDAQIVTNLNAGVTVSSMSSDISSSSVFNTCFSSGAAATGTMNGTWEHLGCVGNSTPGHGVLVQSGQQNRIFDIETYAVFHGVAVRSSFTDVSHVTSTNSVDIIVKSDTASGNVTNVNLDNLRCLGTAGVACILDYNANNSTVIYNSNANNVLFDGGTYGIVINPETGGTIEGLTFTNVSGWNLSSSPIYSYTTTSGVCNQIQISNAQFLATLGVYSNSICSNLNLSNVSINGSLITNQHDYYFNFTGCTMTVTGNSFNCHASQAFSGTIPPVPTQPDANYFISCNLITGEDWGSSSNVNMQSTTGFTYASNVDRYNSITATVTPTVWCHLHHN